MNESYAEAIRTTFHPAVDTRSGGVLSAVQIEEIVAFAYSDASGARPGESLVALVERKYQGHPAELPPGTQYVAFSGVDRTRISNWDNAKAYVSATHGRAGIIGNTPWGEFVEGINDDPDMKTASDKLEGFLARKQFAPARGKAMHALEDTLWNYGSAPFIENAIRSKLPVIGFVDGAKDWRGFTRHELTTLLRSPDTRFNGYAVGAIDGNPKTFAEDAAAEFQQVQRKAVNAASLYGNSVVTPREFDRLVDLSHGYDAAKGTLFGQPIDEFMKQPLSDMAATAHKWSRVHARQHEQVTYRTPLDRIQEVAPDGAHARDILFQPPDADFSRQALSRPGPGAGSRAVGLAGEAALAADALLTTRNVAALNAASNAAGVDSEVLHFGGRNLGAWGGAVLGARTAATLGTRAGPPGTVVGGLAGGLAGAVAGDRIADAIDDARTYHQADRDGLLWRMDPAQPERGWTRSVSVIDPDAARVPGVGYGAPVYRTDTVQAPAELANELNYKASGVQVQLALAHPPEPRDPQRLPADSTDTPSLRAADWHRDVRTGDWTRQVTVGYLDHGLPVSRPEIASPERATQLDAQSTRIVEENREHEPGAIAARYLEAYEQYGWHRFGPPEPAATQAFGQSVQEAIPLSDMDRIDRMLEAARNDDWNAFDEGVRSLAATPEARSLHEDAVREADHREQLAAQDYQIAQQQQQIQELQQQQAQQLSRGMSR